MKEKELLEKIKKGVSKKVLPLSLAGSMVFGMGSINANATYYEKPLPKTTYEDYLNYDGVKIFVNGRYVEFNDDLGYPINKNGRIYVPVRVVAETFGAAVDYIPPLKSVLICKGIERFELYIGSNKTLLIKNFNDMMSDVVKGEIDAKPFIINGRTYVPIRAIFENYNCDVSWDNATKTITVTSRDFTDYLGFNGKLVDLNEIDVNKFDTIIYDGAEITTDYIDLIKCNKDYKAFDEKDRLYIFSYQYLTELSSMYKAVIKSKETGQFQNSGTNTDAEIKFSYIASALSNIYDINSYAFYTYDNEYQGEYFEVGAYMIDYFKDVPADIDNMVNQIKSVTSDKVEQIKLANDMLCDRFTYNKSEIITFGAVEALKTNIAVCSGYAQVFNLIMDGLGIPCITASGKNNNVCHSWNEVYVDNEWKTVCVTFNDTSNDRDKVLLTSTPDYFIKECRTEEDIAKLTYKFN